MLFYPMTAREALLSSCAMVHTGTATSMPYTEVTMGSNSMPPPNPMELESMPAMRPTILRRIKEVFIVLMFCK